MDIYIYTYIYIYMYYESILYDILTYQRTMRSHNDFFRHQIGHLQALLLHDSLRRVWQRELFRTLAGRQKARAETAETV